MDKDFLIRDYLPGDFPGINSLWEETGLGGKFRGDNAEIIEHSIEIGGKLLVMVEKSNNQIIGTSWMSFDGRRIHLHHFAIKPDRQGKGLSKSLVKKSLEFAREKGYQIKLEVHQSNTKAINLYKNAGFQYLGDYDVYIIRNPNEIEI